MKLTKNRSNHYYRLGELALIIAYWIIATRVIVMLEYFSFSESADFLGEPRVYSVLRDSLFVSALAGLAIGLITGLSEMYLFQPYFRKSSFIKLILAKVLVYFISIILIGTVSVFLYNSLINGNDFLLSLDNALNIFRAQSFYHLLLLGLVLSLIINFILIMKNKIGHSIFFPILLGKYHKPREEEHIFLFIDLISSVHTAEHLGHIEYSRLLQDCFNDLSQLVIRFRGSIYQFVGDEAVITWKASREKNYENGILLFFAFEELLKKKSDFYKNKYGLIPEFKGSIHAGKVMVAEVGGSIKSEIAYHGDVLNTGSRMMDLCKIYKRNLVVSGRVINRIEPSECGLEVELHGDFQLRGKDLKMQVFSVQLMQKQNLLK